MARNQTFEMGFPPFRGAVRQIIIASTVIYVVILLLLSFAPELGKTIVRLGELDPGMVKQGAIWQFVTYGFVYVDPLDFVLSLLGVYFLGASVEDSIGSARFYSLYFCSLILSGVAGFALSFTGTIAQGGAIGSGAAANAILMVFYLLFRNAPIMLFPIPIQIPVKWIVLFTAGIETAYLLLNHFALLYCVLLLGLGAGWVWFNVFARRPMVKAKAASVGISERVYGLRNSYYRWKRRRAAKKFQVYMRKHDRTVYFDEYGNYKPPDDKREEGGRGGPWVN
jgi:membrane associated rhomboid family serine protease